MIKAFREKQEAHVMMSGSSVYVDHEWMKVSEHMDIKARMVQGALLALFWVMDIMEKRGSDEDDLLNGPF